ncbi:MAG: diacylglycerol kinase family protein [Cyclobacteriaceae bacterium]
MIRFKFFMNAIRGIRYFVLIENNAKIHLIAGKLAIIAGLLLNISQSDWIALILCIGNVLSLEALNTGVERLCDLIHPHFHPSIGMIKDVTAGAVLIASTSSVIVGLIIFLPHIKELAK